MAPRSNEPSFQIGPETAVRLSYRVFDAEGDLVEDARDRTLVFGVGALHPAIERRIEGHGAGFTCSIDLRPEDAFGPRDAEAILDVDRDEFPADAQVGDRFLAEDQGGNPLVLSLLELNDESVRVDTNHPLAGQAIRVELEILAVRPATLAESTAAQMRLEAASRAVEPLIAPERLLRGRTRGYDSAADAGSDRPKQSAAPRDPAEAIVGEPDKPKIA